MILIVCLLLCACKAQQSKPAASAPSVQIEGQGTEKDPYRIRTAEDLFAAAERLNSESGNKNPYSDAYYLLEADIDLGRREWVPFKEIRGVFDGGGHTISSLAVVDSADGCYGLIGKVYGGTVKDLTVGSSFIIADKAKAPIAGAIVGTMINGVISNCHVGEDVTVRSSYQAGGIVGSVHGDSALISDCTNDAMVWSTSSVGSAGGIAGNIKGNIKNCVNQGEVQSEGDAGGISDTIYGHAENCENRGAVHARRYAGGICCSFGDGALNAQSNDTGVSIKNCSNSGSISSETRPAAGIAASFSMGTIAGCTNSGEILADNEGGGIFGYFQPSAFGTAAEEASIVDCINSGSVTSAKGYNYGVGGIGGNIAAEGACVYVKNCVNTGSINSPKSNSAGGVIGSVTSSVSGSAAVFISCENRMEVCGKKHVGGILGSAQSLSPRDEILLEVRFERCTNIGTVKGIYHECLVGGITGGDDRGMVTFSFDDCINEGKLLAEAGLFYSDDLLPVMPKN